MGLFDKMKDAVTEHKDQVEQGLDKAEELAHDKLADKYDDKIDMAGDKAKEALDKLK